MSNSIVPATGSAAKRLTRIAPDAAKARLHGAEEVALLDVSEPGQYGEGHPFLAVPLPYSRLEQDAPRLLPRFTAPLILLDQGDGVAERAARRLGELGFRDIAAIEGGASGWAAAGYTLYKGVNVPSKTFGELVEEALHTPRMTAEALKRMQDAGEALAQFDGRPASEYRKMTVPGARCCPNAELPHRLPLLVGDPHTPIVVNCAGRTRSIMGAENLRMIGASNPVYALENGTQGWVLAGFALEHDADRFYPETLDEAALAQSHAQARRLIQDRGLPTIDETGVAAWARDTDRSLYCLDVRTPEEFAAGHHPLAFNAPGGQLVQATDQWIAVRNARVVLLDDTGLRAAVAAVWLRAMGHDVAILDPDDARATWSQETPATVGLPEPLPVVEAAALATAGDTQVVDLRSSAAFRRAHLQGAVWSIRPRLESLTLDKGRPVVLTADVPEIAALAALDLEELGHARPSYLPGDTKSWVAAGLELRSGDGPDDSEAIDYLFFVHDRHAGNRDAMRRYLDWEMGLIGQLDAQERAVFDLAPLKSPGI